MGTGEQVTLVEAAQMIGRGYRPAMDLVLRGELQGHRDERGRWWVAKGSIEAWKLKQGVAGRGQGTTPGV